MFGSPALVPHPMFLYFLTSVLFMSEHDQTMKDWLKVMFIVMIYLGHLLSVFINGFSNCSSVIDYSPHYLCTM